METLGTTTILILLLQLAVGLVQNTIPVFDLHVQSNTSLIEALSTVDASAEHAFSDHLFSDQSSAEHASIEIVEIGRYASCITYELQYDNGDSLIIPKELENAMDCPVVLSLAPDNSSIIYEKHGEIISYSFDTHEFFTIATLDADIDGVSNIFWSPSGERLGFVTIKQESYPETTQLHVISRLLTSESLSSEESIKNPYEEHETYDIKVRFSCGSICTTSVGDDIWFSDDTTINYYTYLNDPYEEYSNELLETLHI